VVVRPRCPSERQREDRTVHIVAFLRAENCGAIKDVRDPAGGTFDRAGGFDRLISEAKNKADGMLRYVDPYGDLALNQRQIPELLRELDTILGQDLSPPERRGIDRLRILAQACRDQVHTYLWFVGD
jgi:hypothetical protein